MENDYIIVGCGLAGIVMAEQISRKLNKKVLIIKRIIMLRLIITPKDVEVILGVSSSYARRVVRIIKRKNNKEKHQKITVKEFCRYMGLEVKEVVLELKEFYRGK